MNNREEGVRITVQWRTEDRRDEARSVADRLQARCVRGDRVPPGELRIVFLEDGIQLWDQHCRRRGFPIDFRGVDLRTGSGSLSRKQPLARALGRSTDRIVDATAGLGHDAFLMACLGWTVHAIERHALLGLLLDYSLRHARTDPTLRAAMGDRLTVQTGDSRTILESGSESVDVIYLDPMFQPRKGSALPRKSAQILRQLVPPGIDDGDLLEIARRQARKRVVVKRPDQAPPISDDVSLTFPGKMVRYDVYLREDSP